MIFPRLITRDAGKVRLKAVAFTAKVAFHGIGVMILVSVIALTWRTPCADIEVFSPWQPVHPAFFGSRWYEFELFASTASATC